MFYFSNARSFPLIVFSLLERFGIFLCPRYIAAPGWEVGNPVAGQRLSFCSGGRGSFNVCMWSVNSDVLDLISRIQRLLAICRLWIHESRGRLDTAFLEISALRVRLHSLAAELREPGLKNSVLSSTSIVGCKPLRTLLKKPWNNRLWCSEVLSRESGECQLEQPCSSSFCCK